MIADCNSCLAMNILIGCVLCLVVIITSGSVVVAAEQYDFASERRTAVKPGLCPDPEKVDSQEISSNCDYDPSCLGAKKCCKANTGAMLCLKAGSANGCDVRGKILQKGESVIVDCYNCTCLNGSTLMCPDFNCSGADHSTSSDSSGSCPKAVDAGECFAHPPCQSDSECSGGQKCCDVQCGVPICIERLQSPDIGTGCWNGDKYYTSGQRSNVSNSQLDCPNCLCTSDGNWHCQRHLCTTKLKTGTGRSRATRGADLLIGMLLLPLILLILMCIN